MYFTCRVHQTVNTEIAHLLIINTLYKNTSFTTVDLITSP